MSSFGSFKTKAITIYKKYYKLRMKVPETMRKKYLQNLRSSFVYPQQLQQDLQTKFQLLKEAEENFKIVKNILELPTEYLEELKNIKN